MKTNSWNTEKHTIEGGSDQQVVKNSKGEVVGRTITPPVIPIVDKDSDFDKFLFQQD